MDIAGEWVLVLLLAREARVRQRYVTSTELELLGTVLIAWLSCTMISYELISGSKVVLKLF